MEVNVGKTKLMLVHGDIIESRSEAITNAANDRLWMGGGVAGAIKRAGGEEIENEAMKQGPISPGEVVVTHAGEMNSKYIIHAVVMGQDLKTKDDFIRQATRNTISKAEELSVSSLALPAFGTGVGHFPADECAKIMIEEIVNALLETNNIRQLRLVLKDKGIYEIFKQALENKFSRK